MKGRIKPTTEWTTEDFDTWAKDVAHRIGPSKLYTAVFGNEEARGFLRMSMKHSDALRRFVENMAKQCEGAPFELFPEHKPLRRSVMVLTGRFETVGDLLWAASSEMLEKIEHG